MDKDAALDSVIWWWKSNQYFYKLMNNIHDVILTSVQCAGCFFAQGNPVAGRYGDGA